MIFREAIERIAGMRQMAEGLELASGLARRILYQTPRMGSPADVEHELALVERAVGMLSDEGRADAFSEITLRLGGVKDLRGTLSRLAARRTLDDVELFEVKLFAMAAGAVRAAATGAEIDLVDIPDTEAVVALLDPDRAAIPHFAIYDSYLPELGEVRRAIKDLRRKGGAEEELAGLYSENARMEDEVRARLSADLSAHVHTLEQTTMAVARLDILIAKARQALAMGLCRPQVAERGTDGGTGIETVYSGLFNPVVREALRERGNEFQPVDISLGEGPIVITGANMGGKTVLLKSVALAQALFQYGFWVPARRAQIAFVDRILTSIGDGQDELSGLSSFAAEMVRLDAIIGRIRSGQRLLVLIDEPARTTNPAEGEAIVNALLELLAAHCVRALVTSHYGGIRAGVKRLRVKGFAQNAGNVTPGNIQDWMDYSLMPDDGRPPREALRIARILGVDEELMDRAAGYVNKV